MTNKVIVLLGETAAGKDTIARTLTYYHGLPMAISHTTRPIRTNEIDGNDYYFVGNDWFARALQNMRFIETRTYNTFQDGRPAKWFYGLAKDQIDLNDHSTIFICDVQGYEEIINYFGRENVIGIYVTASRESRLLRAIGRDKNFDRQEFERRNEDDVRIFNDFKDYDLKINNEYFINAYTKLTQFLQQKDIIKIEEKEW